MFSELGATTAEKYETGTVFLSLHASELFSLPEHNFEIRGLVEVRFEVGKRHIVGRKPTEMEGQIWV